MPPSSGLLGIFSVLAVLGFFLASNNLADQLSPQGCRMSYMSPSYVLQDGFNASWTRLAERYSLWLYREVGWDTQTPHGFPVLFIPGNAGSSHQVRSIASSASRQYYSSPGQVSLDFSSRRVGPLDIYAVEFNEDLSAFHGATLQSQIEYTSKAIDFILSRYPSHNSLIILGHSMGGIVGTALLPSNRISAIISMSTPHNLPPARFDSRIDDIYAKVRHNLKSDVTPILSLCGGATDTMIPSESCILPFESENIYRKTIFTSALEGTWTGVGHREMVWCHQVRSRIARALLELGPQQTIGARKEVIDTWLRDGHESLWATKPFNGIKLEHLDRGSYDIIPPNLQLSRRPVGSKLYLLPIPATAGGNSPAKLSVLVGKGSIVPISPQGQHPLQVSIYVCFSNKENNNPAWCDSLKPDTLKLIPGPIAGEPFPSPRIASDLDSGGVDESDGVVLYEVNTIPPHTQWVGIKVENGQGEGWVVAGFDHKEAITSVIPTTSLLFHSTFVPIESKSSMRLDVWFPRLWSNALIVYCLIPHFSETDSCTESHLAPLLVHMAHSVEAHYYPLIAPHDRRILLHTHHPAPYHTHREGEGQGLYLTIYSSGRSSCVDNLKGFELSVDWSATLGRWASRYLITLISWAAGISALLFFLGLGMYDRGAPMPSIGQSMLRYEKVLARFMLPTSLFCSFLPWPTELYLGLGNSGIFAPLAPLILVVSSGLVIASWWILRALLWVSAPLGRIVTTKEREGQAVGRSTVLSMCIVFILLFFFIPWQVAYLGCWVYQLLTCASGERVATFSGRNHVENHPLVDRTVPVEEADDAPPSRTEQRKHYISIQRDNYRLNCHILLFMTWLLPLAAPVLAVWVRTLFTAGLTTPFDGDHFFLNAAPFLVLVDFSSWTSSPILMHQRFEDRISARWALAPVAVVSLLVGGTRPHRIFDAGKIAIGVLVAVRIGRRYWGGAPWTTTEPRRGA